MGTRGPDWEGSMSERKRAGGVPVATSNETLGEKPDSEDALRAECGVWRAPSRPAHSGCKLLHKRAIACIVDIPPPPMYNSRELHREAGYGTRRPPHCWHELRSLSQRRQPGTGTS